MNKVKSNIGVIVDRRLVRLINLTEWNGGICSVTLSDLDETFWFNDSASLQEFLNEQTSERFYDTSLRKGYFHYINENGDKVQYDINEIKRGRIVDFTTKIVCKEE